MDRCLRIVILFAALAVSLPVRAQSRIDCNALNSRILKHPVHYCVYLPASYDAGATKPPPQSYPVLYFLHGLGDNEQTLFNSGGWTLLDDLRQRHKIGEFLIAAPEGGRTFYINSADGSVRYSDFFLQEFVPLIETRYRISKGRSNRAISGISMGGYGNAADGPITSALADAVSGFDQWDELLQKEVAVAHRAIGRIDVETSSAFRSDDEKFSHLVLPAEIVKQRPSSTVEEGSLVVAQAVQKIQHGIALRRMAGSARIIASGKVNAIVDLMFQDPAVQGIAVDPALRMKRKRDSQRREQEDDSETAIHRFSLLVAQSLHGIESGRASRRVKPRCETHKEGKHHGE